jgi:hypothetical protein
MPRAIDLTGRKVGRWYVVRQVESTRLKDGKTMLQWLCHCECGTERVVEAHSLNAAISLSCGCIGREKAVINGKARRLAPGRAGRNSVLADYQKCASKRGLPWELSNSDFDLLTTGDCYYCGVPPYQEQGKNHGRYTHGGIDRVDSGIGYTHANCVSCCKVCNYMKRELSQVAFYTHLNHILTHRGVQWGT